MATSASLKSRSCWRWKPRVLMFDEPTAGMSLDEIPTILDLIEGIKAETHKTVLLVEHRMDVVTRLADRIIVLQDGMLIADGAAGGGRGAAGGAAGLSRRAQRRRIAARIVAMTATADTLLRLEGVYTNIGRYRILHGVNLAARRGRVTMLLGRNGAGKTTTLRTIMGLWKARLGQNRFRRPIDHRTGNAAHRPARHRLRAGKYGHLRQTDGAREYAARHRPRGFAQAHLERVLESFPALKVKWDSPAGSLSGGQKQMLAIGARHHRTAPACC